MKTPDEQLYMKTLFCAFLIVVMGTKFAWASNSLSTINNFAPGSSQINFVSVESAQTLQHKKFSFLGFLDASYQSLAIYNSTQTGDDLVSFTHLGLSYGLSPKLEIGIKGPVIFNQNVDSSQASVVLTSSGFVNVDGFLKYRLVSSLKSNLTLMTQIGAANGDEIFYVGPNSGLNYSLAALYERSFGRWLMAVNVGYIQRTPGENTAGTLPFFEPINSTIHGSLGLGRPITKSTRVSGELLVASHDFVKDNSDRGNLSAEALLSFHTKLKALNLSYGLGAGLTDGIATPAVRGFLGFQYPFGFPLRVAKKEEIDEEEESFVAIPIDDSPKRSIASQIFEDNDDDAVAEINAETLDEVFEVPDTTPAQIAKEEPKEELEVIEPPILPKKRAISNDNSNQKYILDYIEFDFNSANLNRRSLVTLGKVLESIKKTAFKTIKVWGHTDFYGSSIYNEYLGLRRAKAVYNYFKNAGIPAAFIDYDAFGERRPVSVGLSDQKRRKNRRVEIIVIRQGE